MNNNHNNKSKENKNKKKRRSKRVFGMKIDPNSDRIPFLLKNCVECLDKTGLEQEGLFRQSGNQTLILEVKTKLQKGERFDVSTLDAHTVAGLLKMWFRELSVPLLTFELYDMFVAITSINQKDAQLNQISKLLDMMSKGHLVILLYLLMFLKRVEKKSKFNKMNAANLGIVFAPNLLRSEDTDITITIEDTPFANELMTIFIDNYEKLFSTREYLVQNALNLDITNPILPEPANEEIKEIKTNQDTFRKGKERMATKAKELKHKVKQLMDNEKLPKMPDAPKELPPKPKELPQPPQQDLQYSNFSNLLESPKPSNQTQPPKKSEYGSAPLNILKEKSSSEKKIDLQATTTTEKTQPTEKISTGKSFLQEKNSSIDNSNNNNATWPNVKIESNNTSNQNSVNSNSNSNSTNSNSNFTNSNSINNNQNSSQSSEELKKEKSDVNDSPSFDIANNELRDRSKTSKRTAIKIETLGTSNEYHETNTQKKEFLRDTSKERLYQTMPKERRVDTPRLPPKTIENVVLGGPVKEEKVPCSNFEHNQFKPTLCQNCLLLKKDHKK